MTPSKPTRRQHITREEEADRCLNHTVYSKGSQFVAVLFFLLVVFGVPVAQHVFEIRRNLARRAAWKPTSGEPEPGIAPQIYSVFKLLPTSAQISQAKGFWGYWDLIPSAESLSTFEASLKENAVLTQWLLSPTQLVLSSYLGAGNEKAYIGRDGWLFYRPDVEYLTSAGFLDPTQLRLRSHGSTAIQPDPVKAILLFKKQLAARGIQLVVMPMSTKPMIVPEMLVGPSADGVTLQNDSFGQFKSTLESNGVPVFDPTAALLGMKTEFGPKPYLQSDTHWSPEAMHLVALDLGEFLEKQCGLPSAPQDAYALQPHEISSLGDIAEMLKLPPGQTLFPKQTVTIDQVVAPDGSPWRADRHGDVLLLGDSFSNIYSLEGMGWGGSAGFAEHLSYALGRGIDKIVINAGGAFASRRELARQMRQGVDRLAGKKVVVYEFSMRDLSQGDWRMIELAQPTHKEIQPAPPVTVNKTTPVPSNTGLTAFKTLTVTPNVIDVSKHQKAQIAVPAPAGSWHVTIRDAQGNVVRRLLGGTSTVPSPLKDSWDGTDVRGAPEPVGNYVVQIDGTRPDGSALEPVSQGVQVVNGRQTPPLTTPPPIAKQKTPLTKPQKGPAITTGAGTKPRTTPQAQDAGLTVSGRISARATTPKPGSVPYKDCLIALQLTDLKVAGGTIKGQNIVVYVWGLKDDNLVDGAFQVGQTLRFKLTPWSQVESKYGGYNRQELDSDESLGWEAFWGEIK